MKYFYYENLGYIFSSFIRYHCLAVQLVDFITSRPQGLTSKQLIKRSDAKVVGFGGNVNRIIPCHHFSGAASSFD